MGTITSRVTTTPVSPACAAVPCASTGAHTPIPRKTEASSARARRRIVTRRGSVRLLGQALIDQAERRVDVVLVHHERRGEPQRTLPRAQEQKPLLERALHQLVGDLRRWLPGGTVFHEL